MQELGWYASVLVVPCVGAHAGTGNGILLRSWRGSWHAHKFPQVSFPHPSVPWWLELQAGYYAMQVTLLLLFAEYAAAAGIGDALLLLLLLAIGFVATMTIQSSRFHSHTVIEKLHPNHCWCCCFHCSRWNCCQGWCCLRGGGGVYSGCLVVILQVLCLLSGSVHTCIFKPSFDTPLARPSFVHQC